MVPKTAWFTNLRSHLSKSNWDVVRKKCYAKANYKCEICGGKGTKHPVECHEIWDFGNGKITLKGLIALCPSCHEVKHIGWLVSVQRGNCTEALHEGERCFS
ncbi:hypothetical protein SP39_1 [Salmonella phage 39]|nr:hypothetical protein SP39_1 [Salmonella phage 39]